MFYLRGGCCSLICILYTLSSVAIIYKRGNRGILYSKSTLIKLELGHLQAACAPFAATLACGEGYYYMCKICIGRRPSATLYTHGGAKTHVPSLKLTLCRRATKELAGQGKRHDPPELHIAPRGI